MLKRKAARVLALVLALTMVVGLTPVWAVPSAAQEPAVLGGSGITLPEDAEGTFLAFAANSVVDDTPSAMWTVGERGRYAVTIYRAGDLTGQTTVDLRTIDSSAVYGKDYVIDDSRYETEVKTTQGTLLQQYANDEEALAQGQEILDTLSGQIADTQAESPAEGEEQTGEAALTDEIPATEEVSAVATPGIASAEPEAAGDAAEPAEESTADDGKSELAKMKEAQTGLASRETVDTEFLPLDESLISYMIPDVGSAVENSSSTRLTFEPGETEKNVNFVILEDTESEGDELISFALSEPEGAAVFTPSVMSVAIQDDEPVEHSLVTFTDAEYQAEGGKVTVTVTRSGADYSLVTARIRSIDTGSAAEGTNYASVDQQLDFRPYSMEATLEIPVKAQPGEEVSFGLQLYDLKGGEEGANMVATAVIPAGPEEVAAGLMAEESAAELMAAPTSLTIPGFGVESYGLENAGSGTFKIIDNSKNPPQEVGIYVQPTDANGSKENFGDSGSRKNEWDGGQQRRRMTWYSGWAWESGGTKFMMPLWNMQNYQQVYLDYETDSDYEGSRGGFTFNIYGPRNTVIKQQAFSTGYKVSRELRGGKLLYLDYLDCLDSFGGAKLNYSKDKLVPMAWDVASNWINIQAYCERTSFGCIEPDIYVYGYAALYRQYRVSVTQPDALKYIDIGADGKAVLKEKQPAMVFLAKGHNVRYPYQQIGITDASTEPGSPIGGTLKGYYIKPSGTNGNGYYIATDQNVIDLNDALMKDIDNYARDNWNTSESIMKKGAGNVYYMDLEIKPVYERNYITVKIGQNDDGIFSWGILDPSNTAEINNMGKSLGRIWSARLVNINKVRVDKDNGTISGLFAVGDTLNLDAVPAHEDYEYTSCHYEGFKNPADTKAEINRELYQHNQATD